jgi:hypothetical protein
MLKKEVRTDRQRSLLWIAAAVIYLGCLVTVAMADPVHSPTKKATNIPAQELAPALQALARERNFQIVYVSEDISGRSTQGAVGDLTPEEALARLLAGTGFTFKDLDDKTVTIVAATQAAPSRTAASPPPTTPQPAQPQKEADSAPLAEVTIEAQRQALEHRLSNFVASITQESGSFESLARWHRKICPAAAGLTQDQGDFVLGRISAIATTTGAPLAPEKCAPNLFVLFTTDPTKLVKDMTSRNAGRFMALSGQRADGAALKRFAEGSRPIRAWYNAQLTGALGNDLHAFDETDMGGRRPLQNDHATLSRIQHDDVQELTSVLVIVDTRRIDGLKLGAVADYAAMLGLAKINLDADVTGDDSVLRLFTASADAAATLSQLGTWDIAFLKALYGTEQASRMQRASIVNTMLRDASVASQH